MELKELRNFMRVAHSGSVSQAAQDLRLAQPALSRQIRKLEHELGVPLFSRHGRGMRLSAAGARLLEREREREALRRRAQDGERRRGDLRPDAVALEHQKIDRTCHHDCSPAHCF